MAFCPFLSRSLNADGIVSCREQCALSVDGHCAINVLARVSLHQAGVHICPGDTQDQQKKN